MGDHIDKNGEFQSDKYAWCKPGFVPLKLTDPMAQPALATYAGARRSVDTDFSDDLETALASKGFDVQTFAKREAAKQKILLVILNNVDSEGRLTFDPFDSDDLREAALVALGRS